MPANSPALPTAVLTIAELDGFHRFATQRLQSHGALSLEECLRAWRDGQEHQETLADVRTGLADIEAGRYTELQDAVREIRRQLGLPCDA